MSKRGKQGVDASELLALEEFADGLLETCSRRHLSLRGTLDRFLPASSRKIGARAAVVLTKDEELRETVFAWGEKPPFDPAGLPERGRSWKAGGRLWVSHRLDAAGARVGVGVFGFPPTADAGRCAARVRILCEELDGVLWAIQTANLKQSLVDRIMRALKRRVFGEALDRAVAALSEAIPFTRMALLHVHESGMGPRTLHYRLYRGRRCTHDSLRRPHRKLDEAVRSDGVALLSPDRHRVARVLGLEDAVETLFIFGITRTEYLGQVILSTPRGMDVLGRDLLTVFANAVSQRLVDYRRERQHLSQYFSPDTINELLKDGEYHRQHLSPRLAQMAILFADVNGFTRLCERALRDPARIGDFIDHWSTGAVRIIWKHGGVFDKMNGDCVIAHFGPPFYGQTPARLALSAVRAASELQEFTRRLEEVPAYARLTKRAGLPGLGLGIGVNLCPAAVGFFGPHRDFTAFSSGMNETARLQGRAGFRRILVMESVRKALKSRPELKFEGPFNARVKNVGKPLVYWRLRVRARGK